MTRKEERGEREKERDRGWFLNDPVGISSFQVNIKRGARCFELLAKVDRPKEASERNLWPL